jgi:3'5'-cyclic nucleotide phosphodiesterase
MEDETASPQLPLRFHSAEHVERTGRLINWNVEILLKMIKQILAQRNAVADAKRLESSSQLLATEFMPTNMATTQAAMPLEEVKEVIKLPEFDWIVAQRQQDRDSVEIQSIVVDQLRELVTCIANMYRANNQFHNFDHASHVLMSVNKLMSRIVAPSDVLHMERNNDTTFQRDSGLKATTSKQDLHDYTYGITSDPMTQFACAWAALIHDVDHSGVTNAQLIKENPALSAMYKNRSIAEQNSFDLSFNLLMADQYIDLRKALFSTSQADLATSVSWSLIA